MKSIAAICLSLLTISLSAQEIKTNSTPEPTPAVVTNTLAILPTLHAKDAKLTAPMTLIDDALSQPMTTDLKAGGKVVFEFNIPETGDYIFSTVVNATDEGSNSFYVNVDDQPEDPAMVWDIPVTIGFDERKIGWRGKGDVDASEFPTKTFHLASGAHKLIITGREPTELKSIAIKPATK